MGHQRRFATQQIWEFQSKTDMIGDHLLEREEPGSNIFQCSREQTGVIQQTSAQGGERGTAIQRSLIFSAREPGEGEDLSSQRESFPSRTFLSLDLDAGSFDQCAPMLEVALNELAEILRG
jgi:hypothetical protein